MSKDGDTSSGALAQDDPATSEAAYEAKALAELAAWETRMVKPPGPWDRATREFQARINHLIPEKVHSAVTAVMEHMTRAIMTGSDFTGPKALVDAPLSVREAKVRGRVRYYRAAAAAEGGVAGAGGFLLNAAEFPVLIATKIKLLYDIAALYGHDVKAPAERLYILEIFQLAFSGAEHRNLVFDALRDWQAHEDAFEGFDWRAFQQEYRDYIDLAKLAQMLPAVGAPVGVAVNYGLTSKLATTAINAYRRRWFAQPALPASPKGPGDM